MLKNDLIAYLDQYEDGDDIDLDVVAGDFDEQDDTTPEPRADIGARVYVLHVSTRHGENFSVHASAESAKKAQADYVRQYWDEVAGVIDGEGVQVPAEAPEGDDDAIAMYFDNHADESSTIEPLTIQP